MVGMACPWAIAVSARHPVLGDLDEVLDAEAAEADTIEARFDSHDVADAEFGTSTWATRTDPRGSARPTPCPVECRNQSP